MMWNENDLVSILSYSNAHIDYVINDSINPFYFTGFYSNPNKNLRQLLSSLLSKIRFSHSNHNIGWIVGGDFNKIIYDHKKKADCQEALTK